MKKFEEIVDLYIQLIDEGKLKPGDQLPTHRELAYEWGCSIGTASRAYAELGRRGFSYGKIGQGTFIYGTKNDEAAIGKGAFFPRDSWPNNDGVVTDLSKNSYYHPETNTRLQDALQRLARNNEVSSYLTYFDSRGRPRDREIAARWLQTQLHSVESENIIITQGAQSGLHLAMATLASPGTVVATEAFGYPGIRAAAHELDLRLAPIAMDEEGLRADEFEQACGRGNIKLLVTVPTNHNPTGITQSRARREKIIEIAARNKVIIVEDSAYGPLHDRDVPAYADLAPQNTIHLTTLSKVFNPALRIGYLVAPANLVPRLATKMTTINWMTSPILLDLANFLLQSGQVEAQAQALMSISARREKMATDLLEPWLMTRGRSTTAPLAHLWVRLPPTQTIAEFVASARRENIVVVGGNSFAMSKNIEAHHVRLCLMAEPDERRLEKALRRLAVLLAQENSPIMLT